MYISDAMDLIEAMKTLFYHGLNTVLSGNGSIRVNRESFLITPSGLPKHRLTLNDLVLCNVYSEVCSGRYKPSIEIHVHRAIYRARDDAYVVLHAHPPLTTLLVSKGLVNWWISENVESTYSVGKVCIGKQAEPGSKDLAESVANVLINDCRVVIIPNHGVFTWHSSVWNALESIIALEHLAKQYIVWLNIERSFKNKL